MEIFETTCKLRNADVDMHRRFKTASLLTLLQETAIAHTEAIGMGRERTLDRGLLWIITLQRLSILRMPVYDETITVQCWPGKTMHVLFPRYYRMTSETGELLLEGSALWALIDEQSHQLIFPDDYGIRIPGLVTGQETPLPRAPKAVPLTHQTEFTVPSAKGFLTPGAWVRRAFIMSCTEVAPTRQVEDCFRRSPEPEKVE